jgi:hydroxymethylpyrimidine/phosphomethylpyrimidine kinase
MTRLPVALTIAGSDSGGGAGIQADLKTMEALGTFGTSAVTAVTAQNTTGVRDIQEVDPDVVRAQIDAVVEDFEPRAAKTGMLSATPILEEVADAVATHDLRAVVDPVMVAASGDRLLQEDAEATMRDVVVPEARLVTPNLPEAEILLDRDIGGRKDMEAALGDLLDLGPDAVLLKGGHDQRADQVVDLLHDGEEVRVWEKERVETRSTHGTGCTLSAAVAAGLARGKTLGEAVGEAEALVHRGLEWGLDLGEGPGPVHHMADLRYRAALAATMRAVDAAADRLAAADPIPLLPEVGTNLAAAPRYTDEPAEVVGLRGRIVATEGADGTARARRSADGVAPAASSHVGGFLAALLEHDRTARACVNVRHGDDVLGAVDELGWETFTIPWDDEPEEVRETEGATMPWEAEVAMEGRDEAPDALVDPGRRGKEAMVKIVAGSAQEVADRVLDLHADMVDRAGA